MKKFRSTHCAPFLLTNEALLSYNRAMKLSLILDIDSQYKDLQEQAAYVDLSALSGVNGYCSEEAAEEFRKAIRKSSSTGTQQEPQGSTSSAVLKKPCSGIHLFGSGNYHYISKFFLETIEEPFNLLLIDNHPDMEAPEFPLLSCGSWVLDSLRELPNLRQVYMAGVRPDLLADCLKSEGAPFVDRVTLLKTDTDSAGANENSSSGKQPVPLSAIPDDLPLYISIDKDALSTEYALTDWDQGNMTLNEMGTILTATRSHELLGADICGDSRTAVDNSLNAASTASILNILN